MTSARIPWLLFAVAWGTNHFVPLLLVYRATLELSSVELAVLFGVYAIGLLPGLLYAGRLSDRIGRRAVVLPAACVALGGTAILSFGAAGFPVLLAGRFVVGLGAGATFSAGTAWVQDLAAGLPEGTGARRAAVALSCGFGGGPLVTGILAQWLPSPMRLPYAVHALVLGTALSRVAVLPAPARARAPEAPAGGALPAGFGDVAVVAPWVFIFASVSHAVLPALVRARLGGASIVFAGAITATTLGCGVLVQPWIRPWPPRRAALFGLAAGAAGLLAGAGAAAAAWPPGIFVAAVLLGTGYGGCVISGLRFVEANTPPATRGRTTGIFYALTYIGFASPLAIAALGKVTGDVAAIVWASALAVGTLAYLGLRRSSAARSATAADRVSASACGNETSTQSGA